MFTGAIQLKKYTLDVLNGKKLFPEMQRRISYTAIRSVFS